MDISDPVVWGSIATVAGSVVVVVYLVFKMKALINRDSEARKQ